MATSHIGTLHLKNIYANVYSTARYSQPWTQAHSHGYRHTAMDTDTQPWIQTHSHGYKHTAMDTDTQPLIQTHSQP
jgi:hypothetical protein